MRYGEWRQPLRVLRQEHRSGSIGARPFGRIDFKGRVHFCAGRFRQGTNRISPDHNGAVRIIVRGPDEHVPSRSSDHEARRA